VIVINLLDFTLRPKGKNFHQVGELVYREEPHEILTDRLEIHHLQLSKFKEISPDFNNPLHCWLTALNRAQSLKKPLKEIVKMDPHLSAYYKADPGFAEFVERHGLVASNPQTRKEYDLWVIDQILAMDEKAELVAKGRAEGEIESNVNIALNAFRTATSEADKRKVTEILKTFGLPDDIIKSARKRVKAEQEGKA
jgi:hypothetical protein